MSTKYLIVLFLLAASLKGWAQSCQKTGHGLMGIMNYRNSTVVLRQKNMDIGIPFFQTSDGYSVFWDNYSTTTFRDSPGTTAFESETGSCIDYYFMNGGDADHVIARMRRIADHRV